MKPRPVSIIANAHTVQGQVDHRNLGATDVGRLQLGNLTQRDGLIPYFEFNAGNHTKKLAIIRTGINQVLQSEQYIGGALCDPPLLEQSVDRSLQEIFVQQIAQGKQSLVLVNT